MAVGSPQGSLDVEPLIVGQMSKTWWSLQLPMQELASHFDSSFQHPPEGSIWAPTDDGPCARVLEKMRERLPVILVDSAAASIVYSPCGVGEDGMTRLSNVSLALRQKVAQQHILLWRWMALQTHLLHEFSDAFVIPNPTDRTPVITLKAFPTSATVSTAYSIYIFKR
ncbi:hypothetical protein F25303_4346 [Fusarium sp. NRRL 25303]|nr:hypothetical protein F25303_4346 [Fusarium sp. NRRL 25303]